MSATINPEKLAALPTITLTTSSHPAPTNTPPPHLPNGACVMELVSYLADEPWSDHPQCACPVLTSCAIRMNDCGPQWVRDRLRDMVPRIIGTRTDDADIRQRRAYVLATCAAREVSAWVFEQIAPIFPEASRDLLLSAAKALRETVEISSRDTALIVRDVALVARNAAYKVRNAAANDAANAANAAAYAANAAADAAYAAADAANAADAAKGIDRDEPWRIMLAGFERALSITATAEGV